MSSMLSSSAARPGLSVPRLSLVAFIDVVFFLLLYLIMAGTLGGGESQLRSGIESAAPGPAGAVREVPVLLHLEREQDRTIVRIGSRRVEAREQLVAVLREIPSVTGALVLAGPGVRVADVAMVLQAARDAGLERVSYAPSR